MLELPLHIKKAVSNINKLKEKVDLIIVVSDARSLEATNISKYLIDSLKGIKILQLVSKLDLSDISVPNAFNFKLQKNRKFILKLIKDTLKNEEYEKQEYKPHYQILVIGLPNVGKSTLINLLRNKKIAISENRPGVTKKIVKHFLGDNMWLYDSPGIFVYNNASINIIDKLFLINAVPVTRNDYSELLNRTFVYLFKYYYSFLLDTVSSSEFVNYNEFISLVASKYKFMLKGGNLDISKAEDKFLSILRSTKISWDHG